MVGLTVSFYVWRRRKWKIAIVTAIASGFEDHSYGKELKSISFIPWFTSTQRFSQPLFTFSKLMQLLISQIRLTLDLVPSLPLICFFFYKWVVLSDSLTIECEVRRACLGLKCTSALWKVPIYHVLISKYSWSSRWAVPCKRECPSWKSLG